MNYRPYTPDELATCLGMQIRNKRRSVFIVISEIDNDLICTKSFGYLSAKDLLRDWLDLSTDQPCGVPVLEKGELPR